MATPLNVQLGGIALMSAASVVLQVVPVAQAVLHPPQWLGSVVGSTHVEPHMICPAGQPPLALSSGFASATASSSAGASVPSASNVATGWTSKPGASSAPLASCEAPAPSAALVVVPSTTPPSD